MGCPFGSRGFGVPLSHAVAPASDGKGESTFISEGILARACAMRGFIETDKSGSVQVGNYVPGTLCFVLELRIFRVDSWIVSCPGSEKNDPRIYTNQREIHEARGRRTKYKERSTKNKEST